VIDTAIDPLADGRAKDALDDLNQFAPDRVETIATILQGTVLNSGTSVGLRSLHSVNASL